MQLFRLLYRLMFSPCLVNSPFHSSSISCSSCLSFAAMRARSSAQRTFFMASFSTVFLLMMSSAAMNSSGLSTLPCLNPILTKNPPMLLLPPPLLLLSSLTCPQPSSLPLLELPSTVASPSPSIWVLCQTLSPGRRTPEPHCPVPPVYSLPAGICPRMYIPSAVPLPFLDYCCSSPKSHSTLLPILASKTLSTTVSVRG